MKEAKELIFTWLLSFLLRELNMANYEGGDLYAL